MSFVSHWLLRYQVLLLPFRGQFPANLFTESLSGCLRGFFLPLPFAPSYFPLPQPLFPIPESFRNLDAKSFSSKKPLFLSMCLSRGKSLKFLGFLTFPAGLEIFRDWVGFGPGFKMSKGWPIFVFGIGPIVGLGPLTFDVSPHGLVQTTPPALVLASG